MFTWPSPGIQIGQLHAQHAGRDLGDLLGRRSPAPAWAAWALARSRPADAPRRSPAEATPPRRRPFRCGLLLPGGVASGSRGRAWARGGPTPSAPRRRRTASSSWRRATTCRPTGIPSTRPGGDAEPGLAGHVERRGERGRQDHQVHLLAVHRAAQDPFGRVRGRRGRRREQQVDLVEHRGRWRSAARGDGAPRGRGARPAGAASPRPRPAGASRDRRAGPWHRRSATPRGSARSSRPHARPGFGSTTSRSTSSSPASATSCCAASWVSSSTPVSHTP